MLLGCIIRRSVVVAVRQRLIRHCSKHPAPSITATMPEQAASTPSKSPAAKRTPKKQPPAVVPDAALLEKAARIAAQLQELYPSPPIPLEHASPFQLLVAVMLSAQTTDKKVNEVTPELFSLAPDAPAMAAQAVPTVQKIIQPIGLAPTKAKNLVAMAQLLLERHGGQVPSTFEELEALPGVGHKTASVVMAQAFGQPAFPVDTHIHRLAERWGLSSGKSVEQTEADLKVLMPQDTWRDVHLQIIYFGREYCPAKQHDASKCPICSWAAAAAGQGSSVSKTAPSSKKAATPKRKSAAAADSVAVLAAAATAAAAEAGAAAAGVVGEAKPTSRRRRKL